jgi:hypothetical protein
MPARHAVLAGALLLAPHAPMAQPLPPLDQTAVPIAPAPAGGPAAQLSIATTSSLSFGRFVAGSGGSVTVTPSGARYASGGVVLLNGGGSGNASFNVATLNGSGATKSVILSLPANGQVFLSNGASAMAVNNFTSSPGMLISLTPGGAIVDVGATLEVDAGQARGPYSGVFSLTVNYE